MYHYAMIEFNDGTVECASTYDATFRECIRIVSIALSGENKTIKNAWVETSERELMEDD